MKKYSFVAFDVSGNRIGKTLLYGDSLPSHTEICMGILCVNSEAKSYRMLSERGTLTDSTPINVDRYLPFEFTRILQQCNNAWYGAIIELNDGRKVKLTGFGCDLFDRTPHFSAFFDYKDGSKYGVGYCLLKREHLINANVIKKGYNYKF